MRPNLIATNKHVIANAAGGVVKRVRNDTKFDIEGVMATDEKHDLAILRVSGSSISILPLGDSDSVSIGDVVYVVGNPEGFEGTFSDGVISGVRGSNADNGKRLQMTAPISPGSSGGPVLNTRGEVIGVAVSSVIGGQNINFAVPSNYLGLLIGSARKRTPKPLSEGKKSISAEAEFYFLSGMTRYQQLGQHDAAIADFDAAIRVKPDYADAYFGRGAAKADLGRYDAAIADYDVAIRLKPNYADAYIGRGAAKGRSGQHFAAIADYDVAIQLKPDYALAYVNRGIAKAELGQHSAAIANFDVAIRLKPNYADAYVNRGIAKAELGQHFAAIADYDVAIRLKPDDALSYVGRGIAKAKLGQHFTAISDYDAAIRLKPDFAQAYLKRGNAKYDLRLKPDFEAYLKRGNAKYDLGRRCESGLDDWSTTNPETVDCQGTTSAL